MINVEQLPPHPHEINDSSITERVLQLAGYVIKDAKDFSQSKEDYLIGLGLMRDGYYQRKLKEGFVLSHEFKTEAEFNSFRAKNNINNYHIVFLQKYSGKPYNYKLYSKRIKLINN